MEYPAAARSIAAMSMFFIVIIASIARRPAARSAPLISSSSRSGVICQVKPQRSRHQPHGNSAPPLVVTAFQ